MSASVDIGSEVSARKSQAIGEKPRHCTTEVELVDCSLRGTACLLGASMASEDSWSLRQHGRCVKTT